MSEQLQDLDILVNLYNLPNDDDPTKAMKEKGVGIKRGLGPDKTEILEFIKREFSQGWADECEKAIFNSTCYIATLNGEVVGFACYDSTALGYYGPLGVAAKARKLGIGSALTAKCLLAMREKGYGYAIINAGPVEYYIRTLNAQVIGDHPGVYANLICN